jgi:hypothetical protein
VRPESAQHESTFTICSRAAHLFKLATPKDASDWADYDSKRLDQAFSAFAACGKSSRENYVLFFAADGMAKIARAQGIRYLLGAKAMLLPKFASLQNDPIAPATYKFARREAIFDLQMSVRFYDDARQLYDPDDRRMWSIERYYEAAKRNLTMALALPNELPSVRPYPTASTSGSPPTTSPPRSDSGSPTPSTSVSPLPEPTFSAAFL